MKNCAGRGSKRQSRASLRMGVGGGGMRGSEEISSGHIRKLENFGV